MSVLTPTIPERSHFLAECKASVSAQTYHGKLQHIVMLDYTREGCAATVNRCARQATGDYLLIVADDDLLLPGCIEALLKHAGERIIVYPKPLVWGEPDNNYCMSPPGIPSLALIPAGVWRELGGYDESLNETEDRDLWTRALHAKVEFVRYDESPTWMYRFHGGNKSRHNGVAH